MTRNGLVGAVLFILTLIPIVVVNYYPVGDWMSGPLLLFYILIPLSIVQLVITVLNSRKKENSKGLVLQTAIMLLCNALMLYYIRKH